MSCAVRSPKWGGADSGASGITFRSLKPGCGAHCSKWRNPFLCPRIANARAARRAGFRAILPDDIDRQLAALKRPIVDMAALAGPGGSVRRDMRPVYLRQLAAIDAVLKHPERYARRVRRTLNARAKRPAMRLMQVRHRPARSDLMRVSPNSDLGRQLWYYDTS